MYWKSYEIGARKGNCTHVISEIFVSINAITITVVLGLVVEIT